MEVETTLAGRFVLEHVAGSGGMGVVHRGHDLVSGWDVAVKMLHPTDAGGRARFEREAAALERLEHDAIVGYVAHGATPDGQLFLVTEWIDGGSLEGRLANGPLTITEALTLGRRIAAALSASHARGIVHRDVKPSNVLLPAGDIAQAKLIDFGIARAGALSSATQSGIVIGTPGYMAPEQARGEGHVDGRADLFSLGCVLYEALAGVPPFDGEHLMAILAKILLMPAAPLASVRSGVPAALSELVARMLAKSADERPASAGAVREALRAVVVDPAHDAPPLRTRPVSGPHALEARLVSVVVVTDRTKKLPPRIVDTDAAVDRPTLEVDADLSELAVAFEGTLEMLADGSHLLLFSGRRAPPDSTLSQEVHGPPSADPRATADQATRAARCALRIQERMGSRAVVALATGRGWRSVRWPVGEAIDRAVELARRALPPGAGPDGAPSPEVHRPAPAATTAVWIDDMTAGLLDARWEVLADGDAHRLVREVSEAAEDGAPASQAAPFVGRLRELRLLETAVRSTFESAEASAVLVKGAAGSGKTRLRAELTRALGRGEKLEYDLWFVRADEAHRASPLATATQIVRAAARAAAGGRPSAAHERLGAEIERCPPSGPLEDRALRAFEDFLVARCAERPVLVVVEDLQWADGPSLRFLDAALRRADRARLCVLGLGRPEVDELFPGLWAERRLVELRLLGLGGAPARQSVAR